MISIENLRKLADELMYILESRKKGGHGVGVS